MSLLDFKCLFDDNDEEEDVKIIFVTKGKKKI